MIPFSTERWCLMHFTSLTWLSNPRPADWELRLPTLGAWSLSHWTTREVPRPDCLFCLWLETGFQMGTSGCYFWLVIKRAKVTSRSHCFLHQLSLLWSPHAPRTFWISLCSSAAFPFYSSHLLGPLSDWPARFPGIDWPLMKFIFFFPYSVHPCSVLSPLLLLLPQGSPSLLLPQLPCVYTFLPIKIRFYIFYSSNLISESNYWECVRLSCW